MSTDLSSKYRNTEVLLAFFDYYLGGILFYKIADAAPLKEAQYGPEVLLPDDPRLFALDQILMKAQIDIEDRWLADAYRRREEELENLFQEFLHLGRLESISAVNYGPITNSGDERQDAITEKEETSQDVLRGSVFLSKEMIHE